MFLKNTNILNKLYFSTQGAQSVTGIKFTNKGHKPPAIADSAAGRYAGALFTSASKS